MSGYWEDRFRRVWVGFTFISGSDCIFLNMLIARSKDKIQFECFWTTGWEDFASTLKGQIVTQNDWVQLEG